MLPRLTTAYRMTAPCPSAAPLTRTFSTASAGSAGAPLTRNARGTRTSRPSPLTTTAPERSPAPERSRSPGTVTESGTSARVRAGTRTCRSAREIQGADARSSRERARSVGLTRDSLSESTAPAAPSR
ncbi:hypothetical protein D7231_19900 [Streptomyces klenkii]|uniref:Uncharacterized protein n=1 Tax=Streptomyces klenkii TaxID=1420899 RepID=A0A3B0BGU9_9ACTN|nr:hypothetical protein D7231_19900 [Streptomyces klenkii]